MSTEQSVYYTYTESPIGPLLLTSDGSALTGLHFSTGDKARGAEAGWERREEPFRKVVKQLQEYFDGKRKEFDIQLQPNGTDFQLAVLDTLQQIPYGETWSYREVAEQIGNPKAVRAVGAANGRNPIAVIIPCHRVIGAGGDLTGFGGGLPAKEYLLALEANNSGLFG